MQYYLLLLGYIYHLCIPFSTSNLLLMFQDIGYLLTVSNNIDVVTIINFRTSEMQKVEKTTHIQTPHPTLSYAIAALP